MEKVRSLEKGFDILETRQIPRQENRKADYLAKMGSAMVECRERKVTVFRMWKEELMAIGEFP